MISTRSLVASLALLAAVVPFGWASPVAPQAQSESLANAILAARRKNAAMLQQYNWNSRAEVLQNGKLEDLRIDLVTVGPDGQPSRTLLNDQPGQLPGGFLRRAIAQGQQQQAEKTAKEIGALVDQYTLPSAGKVIAFIVQAQVQPITSPQGTSQLQVTGSNVVAPGDTVTMLFDGSTLQPVSISINTTSNGDAVSVSGTFATMASGLNRLQYATASVPSKQLTVLIHNYDFVPIN